jgi:hypothetical protein
VHADHLWGEAEPQIGVGEVEQALAKVPVFKRHSPEPWRGGIGAAPDLGITDKFARAHRALAQIRLMTNPSDPDHQQLNEALALVIDHLQHDDLREQDMASCLEQVVSLGRGIIRREWARVKRGV